MWKLGDQFKAHTVGFALLQNRSSLQYLLNTLALHRQDMHPVRVFLLSAHQKSHSSITIVPQSSAALLCLTCGCCAVQVDRQYMSITLGCPKTGAGRVEANVGRDLRDRKRMAAFTAHSTL